MNAEERERMPLVQSQRTKTMLDLCRVARKTGDHVLSMGADDIHDTENVHGHQYSTADDVAASALRRVISEVMPDFTSDVVEEADGRRATGRELKYPIMVCDALEGSTNTKRALASKNRGRPIFGGTSAMVLERAELSSIVACAVYDFASKSVYSAVRTEPGSFLAFLNRELIPQAEVQEARGDSQWYAVVPGYSHGNVKARCEVEEAIQAAGGRTTGGCRSSLQDLLDMVSNQVDAYVDLRALFSGGTEGSDEVLHPWDVGGALPVLDGLGFTITDENGVGWQKRCFGEPLTLIAARPSLAKKVLEAVQTLSFLNLADRGSVTLPMPPPQIG
ncbi:MAG: hypothetical protein ABIH36_03325 [bacterium]